MGSTLVYTAIIFRPDDIAENVRKYGGVVPGIRPGKPTSAHIDAILTRTTWVWALCLALVAILPELMLVGFRADTLPVIGDWLAANVLPELAFITGGLGVPFYFGGVSLLIVVGVSMDTVQQIELIIRRPSRSGGEGSDDGSTLGDAVSELSAAEEYETFVPVVTPRGAALLTWVPSLLQTAGIRFIIKNDGVQDLFSLGRAGTDFSIVTGAPVVCVEPGRAEDVAALFARIEAEQHVGTVMHYFSEPHVGVLELDADLEVGETLRFRGGGADFQQVAQSMQIDHRSVQTASAATAVAVQVDQRVRAGTRVYRVTPAARQTANTVPNSSPPTQGVK